MGADQRGKRLSFVIGPLLFLLAAAATVAVLLVNANRRGAPQEGGLTVCPGPAKSAISVWTGEDGTAAGDALATCADMRAGYRLEPDRRLFLGNFGAERPELNTLLTLDEMRRVLEAAREPPHSVLVQPPS